MRFAILCHDKEDEQFAFKISMCEMTNSFMFIFSQLSIYCKITMEIGTFPFKYYVHNFTFYALSSLAYSDAEKANLFAKRLSGVYRYILDTRETDKVTTDVEMAFVRACPPCHPDKHPDAGGERPQAQHQHRVIPAEDTDRNQR